MIRKLGILTAALVCVVASAAPSQGGVHIPRTAMVADHLPYEGALLVYSGQAAETIAGGSTVTIAASCEILYLNPLTVVTYFDLEPVCHVVDATTGRSYRLKKTTQGHVTGAASTFSLPAAHDYRLCVGVTRYGSPLFSQCKAMTVSPV